MEVCSKKPVEPIMLSNMSFSEKLEKISLIPQTKLNILSLVYESREIDEHSAYYTPKYSIYKAEVGKGNAPIFIKTSGKHSLELGEIRLYLRRIVPYLDWDYNGRELKAFAKADPYIKALVDANDKRKEPVSTKELGEIIEREFMFYEPSLPCPIEVIRQFTEEEIKHIINNRICNGFKYDPKVFRWAKAGLVRFPNYEDVTKFQKYRGHTLIIKNHKTGVSTISQHIGKNIDQISERSMEGWADAQGNLYHSSLHGYHGSINIDEFLTIPDHSMSKIYNFLETGRYNTYKAGIHIENEGAPRLTFTTNPKEIEMLKDGSLTQYGYQYIDVFTTSMQKLTTTPSAAFSRFGRIIFDPTLQTATLDKEIRYTEKQQEKIATIAESMLTHCEPIFLHVYSQLRDWLNQEIPEYTESLKKTLERETDIPLKQAWFGHKAAFRHIRGEALAEACIDSIYYLLQDFIDIEGIQELAEEKLFQLCQDNLESLQNIINLSTNLRSDDILKLRVDGLKPEYLRAIIYVAAKIGIEREERALININEIREEFEKIDTKDREKIFGNKYSYWSQIEQKIGKESAIQKIRDRFSNYFGIEVVSMGETVFAVINNVEVMKKIYGMSALSILNKYPYPSQGSKSVNRENTTENGLTEKFTINIGKFPDQKPERRWVTN